jgi:hypothetical protein
LPPLKFNAPFGGTALERKFTEEEVHGSGFCERRPSESIHLERRKGNDERFFRRSS